MSTIDSVDQLFCANIFVQFEIREALRATKKVVLVHESDVRHRPFDFGAEVEAALIPLGLGAVTVNKTAIAEDGTKDGSEWRVTFSSLRGVDATTMGHVGSITGEAAGVTVALLPRRFRSNASRTQGVTGPVRGYGAVHLV